MLFVWHKDLVEFQTDKKSVILKDITSEKVRVWYDYTDKDVSINKKQNGDFYHPFYYSANVLRALLDAGVSGQAVIKFPDICESLMEFAVKRDNVNSIKILLLHGVHPMLDCNFDEKKKWRSNGRDVLIEHSYKIASLLHKVDIQQEMERWIVNKKAYEHEHSALIPFVFGTASLDWPVLVSTIVAEYLVWVNDDRIAQFTETKSWDIAKCVKEFARKN